MFPDVVAAATAARVALPETPHRLRETISHLLVVSACTKFLQASDCPCSFSWAEFFIGGPGREEFAGKFSI